MKNVDMKVIAHDAFLEYPSSAMPLIKKPNNLKVLDNN